MTQQDRMLGDRFRLTRELGRGGMGVVWHAVDELLGREVAIKQIRVSPDMAPGAEAALRDRMIREARAAARLNHSGAVTVYDVVVAGDIFIVMELVQAPSLQELVAETGPLGVHRVAAIGAQMLDVLCEAHRIGIVHRDVKPPNVMVANGDRVKLADFGIAHLAGDPTLTATGGFLGSPAYMAPEQIRGEPSSPAVDLWALGATLYFAVEGVTAFAADTPTAAIAAVLTRTPSRPHNAGPELERVLYGLLTKEPTQRPPVDWLHAEFGRICGNQAPAPFHPVPFQAVPFQAAPVPFHQGYLAPPAAIPTQVYDISWRDYLLGESPESAVDQALANFESGSPQSFTVEGAETIRHWDGQSFVRDNPTENRAPDHGEYQISWTCQVRATTDLNAIRAAIDLLANSAVTLTFSVLDGHGASTTIVA